MLRPSIALLRASIALLRASIALLRPYIALLRASIALRPDIGRALDPVNDHDPMHVIGHDDERIQRDMREMSRDLTPAFARDSPRRS